MGGIVGESALAARAGATEPFGGATLHWTMKTPLRPLAAGIAVALAAALTLWLPTAPRAATPSPYAGQQTRAIKALSASEQADWLAGKGMGLAKAAELNGYPGPAHVLELAAALALSADQLARTRALHATMQQRAQELGRELVAAEQALDQRFAARTVTVTELRDALARIGRLQAEIRAAHLEAHLEQVRVLDDEQIARYAALRGYAASATDAADSARPGSPGHGGGHRH